MDFYFGKIFDDVLREKSTVQWVQSWSSYRKKGGSHQFYLSPCPIQSLICLIVFKIIVRCKPRDAYQICR